MADEQFVARSRLHHGGYGEDGANTEVWYEAGDEIDTAIFTETDIAAALAVGTIVPKPVWDALQAAEEARVNAERAQLAADTRLQQLQHVSRSADNQLNQLQGQELTDEEKVKEVTQRLNESAKEVQESDVPEQQAEASTPQVKPAVAKPTGVRSKEQQNPSDTTDKQK